MKISIQIIVDLENGEPAFIKPITEFRREDLTKDILGLTIKESKLLLQNIQSEFTRYQVEEYTSNHKTCDQCHKKLKIKGHTEIVYRTLFGKLKLSNPRLYKCSCNKDCKSKSISLLPGLLPERISPELQYLEAKWASLVSYGVTSNILEDILPLHVNVSSIFYATHNVAKQLDAEIEE